MSVDRIIQDIETALQSKGYTRYRLAKESGIPEITIKRILEQKNSPSIDKIIKICHCLDLEIIVKNKNISL